MGKRKRSSSSISFDVDDILVGCTFSTSDGKGADTGDAKMASVERASETPDADQKESTSERNDLTESWESKENLTAAVELDLFNRKDEELADMALFLARALHAASTPRALQEFFNFMETHDTKSVLLALKHIGAQTDFFVHLCCATHSSPFAVLLLRYVHVLAQEANVESLSDPDVIRFFLRFLGDDDIKAPAPSASPASSHWSKKRKRREPTPPASPTPEEHQGCAALNAIADRRCPETASLSPLRIAVSILLDAILRQNSDAGLFHQSNSIVFQFAQAGGLSLVAKKLEEHPDFLPGAFFSLVEVLTVSESLAETSPFFFPFAAAVVKLYLGTESAAVVRERLAVLRIMTNLTNIKADVFAQRAADIGKAFSSVFGGQEGSLEERTFTVCCAVNMGLCELRNRKWEFVFHLLTEAVLDSVVAALVRYYHDGGTEKLVLSGYYSLLLAVLSLHTEEKLNARVRVLTAVAKGTRHLEVRDKIRSKPMTYVAVILQEFIIFQGQIGTFTKKSFAEVSGVLAQLIEANDIHVESK